MKLRDLEGCYGLLIGTKSPCGELHLEDPHAESCPGYDIRLCVGSNEKPIPCCPGHMTRETVLLASLNDALFGLIAQSEQMYEHLVTLLGDAPYGQYFGLAYKIQHIAADTAGLDIGFGKLCLLFGEIPTPCVACGAVPYHDVMAVFAKNGVYASGILSAAN